MRTAIAFATPFEFGVWTIPSSENIGCLPTSLYTFLTAWSLARDCHFCEQKKVSPNLTDKHYEIALITALANFSYQDIIFLMNLTPKCIICEKNLIGKQRLFCSIPCKNKKHQSYPSQKIRGLSRKLELVKRLWGCCEKCGYKKNLASLSFHRIDPANKSFKLDVRSLSNRTLERIEKELEQCILLCHNCHAEEHYPDLELEKLG